MKWSTQLQLPIRSAERGTPGARLDGSLDYKDCSLVPKFTHSLDLLQSYTINQSEQKFGRAKLFVESTAAKKNVQQLREIPVENTAAKDKLCWRTHPTSSNINGWSECCHADEMPYLYPEAKGILFALEDRGINMAIASRSPTPEIAKQFLNKLKIQSLFLPQEIYSSWTHKTDHFQRIHTKTGVPYNSMLFFDDEYRNIDAVSKMGVTSILVNYGVNLEALKQGLLQFSQKSGSSGGN